MLFQLSPQLDLSSVFPGGPVVGQDEVGMHAVENSELAHGVRHGLIWPDNLQDFKRKRWQSEKERAKYEKENQPERKQREKDESVLWYSENSLYPLPNTTVGSKFYGQSSPVTARLYLRKNMFTC